MTEITKDMLIGDILDADRGTAKYFLEMGMHCLGCPASRAAYSPWTINSVPRVFNSLMSTSCFPL